MSNDHIPSHPPHTFGSWPASPQPGPPGQPPMNHGIPGPPGAPPYGYGAPQPGWGQQHYAPAAPGYGPGYGPGYAHGYGYNYDPDVVQLAAGPVRLASQGVRLGARIVDGIVLIAGLMLVYGVFALPFLLGIVDGGDTASHLTLAVMLTALVIGFLTYEPLSLWRYGCTLGKRMCGLRVCRDDGNRVTLGAAFARFVFPLVLAIVPFGGLFNVLWCTWDKPYRQCLHDKVASTVVITVKH
ncbi:RDD family protein [Streptomyces sp. NA04227]|uniref:RDD family protein n=1 Tax=Streptomyces sp. NA04227 TaxID=2742136 RepID=UPI001590A7E8|nr:RDD family protein [Streptomyces sp. NA04227]QKW07105.1 RDD family protein [Streptomyces sp. NA04227]